MNTAIIGGAQGLGFAIPIHTAQQIADQLITKGKVDHPYLGIQMATLTPTLKERLSSDPNFNIRIRDNQGVLIVGVARNSPAARAGLRPGDVIRKVGGRAVKTVDEVQQAVGNSRIGSNLPVEISREGRGLIVAVKPGAFPVQASQ